MQPTFLSSVTPATRTEPWSTDPPIHLSSTPPPSTSLLGSVFTSRDKKIPSVQVSGTQGGVEGEGKGEEPRPSSSPHRMLTQSLSSEHSGTDHAPSILADSGSFQPLGSEVAQDREDEEESLVERKTRSKSKDKSKKKKKKKRKTKSEDAAGNSKTPDAELKPPEAAAATNGAEDVTSSSNHPPAQQTSTADRHGGSGHGSPKPHPSDEAGERGRGASLVEPDGGQSLESTNPFGADDDEEMGSEERSQVTYRVKEVGLPWEGDEWPPRDAEAPSNFTPPVGRGSLGEYMEECDVGFGRGVEPLPLPQTGSNKRLSLADELEMAMEDADEATPQQEVIPPEPHPSADLPQLAVVSLMEEQTTTGTQEGTTPPTDSTPSSSRKEFQSDDDRSGKKKIFIPSKYGHRPRPLATPPVDARYDSSPQRPSEITERDRTAMDIEIDDNARLVISLDILHREDEKLLRLTQVATPTGVGQQRTCYILVTSDCTYILKRGESIPWAMGHRVGGA